MTKAKVICVWSPKGGVAKTTTSQNIAVGLANRGKKVLAIDLDPNGILTLFMQDKKPDEIDTTIVDILMDIQNDIDVDFEYAKIKTNENITIIPCNVDMCNYAENVFFAMKREEILRKYIETQKEYYDYIILDCAGTKNTITTNALVASNSVIVPFQTDSTSEKSIELTFREVLTVHNKLNDDIEIEGFLCTNFENEHLEFDKIAEYVTTRYKGQFPVFNTKIPHCKVQKKAQAKHKSIFNYMTSSAENIKLTSSDYKGKKKLIEAYNEVIDKIENR